MIGNRRVTSSLAAILAIMGAAAPSLESQLYSPYIPKPKKKHQRHAGAKELARRAKRMAVQDGLN